MSLASGTRLGPYEILAQIGAGGMGEVYRARDTRLDRIVAIKVLSTQLSNSGLKQRFEREARTISSLSHPNICALYDVGQQDGIDYLVMEFLEGETLAERLIKGPLAIDQVLRFGMQIADALDKAHRQGVVHRDLKPGNIMITRSGIKLLDFGLAKYGGQGRPPSGLEALSSFPTEERSLTAEGTIIGTLQYMAPEQVEGRDTDVRTDIFAMGVVLYEMATGRKAFTGKSQASLIAAILSSEPTPISTIQPMSPPAFNRLVKTCLAKDPEDRWQTARDLKRELDWIAESSSLLDISTPRKNQFFLWFITGVALLLVSSLVLMNWFRSRSSSLSRPISLSILIPEEVRPDPDLGDLAISPDGSRVVFSAANPQGQIFLWVRELRSFTSRVLPGTQGAQSPFWSPDSQTVAFFADGKLKKIGLQDLEPQILCPSSNAPGGGTWSGDGVILFSPLFEGPLFRVAATGGSPTQVTVLDQSRKETHHLWPQFLPDGRHFLFHIWGRREDENAGVYVGSLDTKEKKRVIGPDQDLPRVARFAAPDTLIYTEDTALMAQHFDPDHLTLSGDPVQIANSIARHPAGMAFFTASEQGTLAYWPASIRPRAQLTWMDRTGAKLNVIGGPLPYFSISLSPDERRVVSGLWDQSGARRSIWIIDLLRSAETKFTFNPDDMQPLWSPDGSRIVYSSARDTPPNLFLKHVSGGQSEERLFRSGELNAPTSWSSDGRYILYEAYDRETKLDVWALDLENKTKSIPLVRGKFNDSSGQISPDGNWLAYVSDESGREEVYVLPFLTPGEKLQISTNGGSFPLWRRDRKELFYLDSKNNIRAVPLTSSKEMEAAVPIPLFQINPPDPWFIPYAVSADGKRFLINERVNEESPNPAIMVVMNWTSLIRK